MFGLQGFESFIFFFGYDFFFVFCFNGYDGFLFWSLIVPVLLLFYYLNLNIDLYFFFHFWFLI